jgi:hypothetical protein
MPFCVIAPPNAANGKRRIIINCQLRARRRKCNMAALILPM